MHFMIYFLRKVAKNGGKWEFLRKIIHLVIYWFAG